LADRLYVLRSSVRALPEFLNVFPIMFTLRVVASRFSVYSKYGRRK